ncbi:YhgE/Pip family protein [Bifidobacterium psychraerophilum]|uniref:YhgE/Pip family protein n=1 Tax=Bifidobacterium psychraerophilum TaxID=218140 RepID=UPI0039EB9FEB
MAAVHAAVADAGKAPKRSRSRQTVDIMVIAVLIVLAVLPLIYAGLLTDANIDPVGRLDNVDAAIVNLDEGKTITTAGKTTTSNLGDQVADTMTGNSSGTTNFNWHATTQDDASDGLKHGRYLVTMVIPKDFTADALSSATSTASQAAAVQQGNIDITTDDSVNYLAGTIAQTVGTALERSLSGKVSSAYLDKVYLTISGMHDSLSEASDGAGALAAGTKKSAAGAGTLATGLSTMSEKTAALPTATKQLADGASAVGTGVGALASGSQTLATGTQTLTNAVSALPTATQSLSSGVNAVANAVQPLSTGAGTLANATAKIADGASQSATGAANLASGSNDLHAATSKLSTGADGALAGAASISSGAAKLSDSAYTLQQLQAAESAKIQKLMDSYDSMDDAERIAALQEIQTLSQQLKQGTTALSGRDSQSGLTALSAASAQLLGSQASGSSAATGLTALSAGAKSVDAGASQLSSGAGTLSQGLATLSSGAKQSNSGAQSLASGLSTLNANMPKLTAGAAKLNTASSSLVGATSKLSSGAGTLNGGLQTLNAKVPSLASGLNTLNTQSQTLVLSINAAAKGSQQLSTASSTIASGSKTLASALSTGADKVPSYTNAQAKEISSKASQPVTVTSTRNHKVSNTGSGMLPYFLGLALWLGALSTFMMRPALRAKLMRKRRSPLVVALGSYLPYAVLGMVQAIAAVSVVHWGIGVDVANLWGLFLFTMFASCCYMAISQACIVLLGDPGKFVLIMLMVTQLTSGGGTYPVETTPAFFQAVNPYLPMTYVIKGIRSLIGGGSVFVGPAIAPMLIWGITALLVTFLSASILMRKVRSTDPAEMPMSVIGGASEKKAEESLLPADVETTGVMQPVAG